MNNPDEDNLPTYEDAEAELGLDKMSFFSDMVRPDSEEEQEE
jgi:hypothetical protein